MTNIKLINRDTDQHAGWKPPTDYRFAESIQFVPVVLEELSQLLPVFPLAFLKLDGAPPKLVAVTTRGGVRKLYVAPDGRWVAPYVPAVLRFHPFMMQASAAKEQQFSLAFNRASGLYVEKAETSRGEIPFFTEDGELSPPMQAVVANFQTHLKAERLTRHAVAALEKFELLERWPGENTSAEQNDARALYRIDEPRLNAADAATLKELQAANALALAYAQLFSLSRMETLARLAAFYEAREREAAPPAPDPSIIEKLLGSGETLKFG